MDSVPVWLLTAVIEVSLLCIGALGLLCGFLWRGKRQLRLKMIAFQHDLEKQLATVETPVATEERVETSPLEEEEVEEVAAIPVDESEETALETTLPPEEEVPLAAETPLEEEAEEVAAASVPPEEPEEAEPAGALTQDMLDDLFATPTEDEVEEEEEAVPTQDHDTTDSQQLVTELLSENTVMEQQIDTLQEKSRHLSKQGESS